MWRKRWLIGLAVAAFMLAACSIAQSAAEAGPPIETLAGETRHVSDYEGQVVVINFWATWCGPCRVEMPELQAYYDAHADDPGFAMLAVNGGETRELAQAYVDEFGYTFPVGLDPDGAVAEHLGGVRGLPTTLVLDEGGEIVYQHAGALNRDVLEAQVTPLLAD